MRIEGKPKGMMEVKRFYLEGMRIFYTCPKCNIEYEWNDYLSYPNINKPDFIHFYCNNCDHEWLENIILKVDLKSL